MRQQALVLFARALDVSTAFFFIVLIIWLGGTTVYGEIAYYAAFFIPVQAFAYAKYIETIRFAGNKTSAFQKQLIYSAAVFALLGTGVATALVLSHANALLILMLFFQKLIEISDDVSKAYRFAVDRMYRQILQSALKLGTILILMFGYVLVLSDRGGQMEAVPCIIILAIAQLISAGSVSGIIIRRAFRKPVVMAALSALSVQRSFVAGAINLACSLTATLPRIFLGVFASLSDVAVFTVCYQVAATLVNLIVLNLLSAIGKFHVIFLNWFGRVAIVLLAISGVALFTSSPAGSSPNFVQLGIWSAVMALAVSFRSMAVGISFKENRIRRMLGALLIALCIGAVVLLGGFVLGFLTAQNAAFLFVCLGCIGAAYGYGMSRIDSSAGSHAIAP